MTLFPVHAKAALAGHGPIEIAHPALPDTYIPYTPYSLDGIDPQIACLGFIAHCADMRSSDLLRRPTIRGLVSKSADGPNPYFAPNIILYI